MKKNIFTFFAFLLFFSLTGCLKGSDCNPKTVQSEQAAIIAYAASNGVSAIADPSGLYYQIINPGSGARPTIASTVSVRYTGKLTDGTIFDQQLGTPIVSPLSNLIAGWQIGLSLIQKGGSIKLIVPSSLGYGCKGIGPIPADAILYFEIELVDVQ